MSTAIRRRPVRRAMITAVAVAAGALGVLPASPASAEQTGAVTGGSLSWGLSSYLNSANQGRPNPHPEVTDYTAVFDAVSRVTSWGDADGTVAPDGSATLTFEGTSVNWATTGNSWLKIVDPEVTVNAAGVGALSATVSYGVTTGGVWSTATTTEGPETIDLVDLSVNPGSGDATYPDYTASPFSFATTASKYTWNNLRGRWSPELLQFLWGSHYPDPPNGQAGDCAGSVGCWIYGSSVNHTVVSSVSRYPSLLSISLDRAVASTATTFGTATDAGVPLNVTGTGFKKTAPGVYVSLREYADGAAPYAGGAVWGTSPTAWVSNNAADIGPDPATGAQASIGDDGSFTASLLLTPTVLAALDPAKKYSLVTRKAHGQGTIPSNADQVTETPVDVSSLKRTSTVAATVADTVVGTAASVQVAVTGADATVPTGSVTVKNGATTVGTGTLAGGTATVPVSGLPAGATELTVQYAGTAAHWPSAKSATATVAKVASSAAITAPATSTYGKAVKVSVAVPGATGPVTLTGAGAAQTGTLTDGVATFTLPATLAAGAHTVTASYAGDANRTGATATHRLTVAKAATSTTVKLSPKPTARKNGRVVVTLKGATTGSRVVVVVKKAGKVVKKVTVKVNGKGRVAVALPKAAKGGAFALTATYAGDRNHKASSKKASYRVVKPKKR